MVERGGNLHAGRPLRKAQQLALLHRTGFETGLLRWTVHVLVPSCQLRADTSSGHGRHARTSLLQCFGVTTRVASCSRWFMMGRWRERVESASLPRWGAKARVDASRLSASDPQGATPKKRHNGYNSFIRGRSSAP